MSESEIHIYYARSHARVLGCLNNGEITIIIAPGHGIFLCEPISVDWIPTDLRMPNSEFDILVKFPGGERIRILRKGDVCPEIDQTCS
jgi:hypothetical protein